MHRPHDFHTATTTLVAAPASAAPTMRASDEDRARVSDVLQAHYVAGRLDATELGERVEQALGARTLGDLDLVLADLPALDVAGTTEPGARARHERTPRADGRGAKKGLRAHATSYLLVVTLLVTIWLLTTPGGYFWPVWPMLGWGIGLASHGLAARGTVWHGSRRARLVA